MAPPSIIHQSTTLHSYTIRTTQTKIYCTSIPLLEESGSSWKSQDWFAVFLETKVNSRLLLIIPFLKQWGSPPAQPENWRIQVISELQQYWLLSKKLKNTDVKMHIPQNYSRDVTGNTKTSCPYRNLCFAYEQDSRKLIIPLSFEIVVILLLSKLLGKRRYKRTRGCSCIVMRMWYLHSRWIMSNTR